MGETLPKVCIVIHLIGGRISCLPTLCFAWKSENQKKHPLKNYDDEKNCDAQKTHTWDGNLILCEEKMACQNKTFIHNARNVLLFAFPMSTD